MRLRVVLVLIALVMLVFAAACSDAPTGPVDRAHAPCVHYADRSFCPEHRGTP